MKRYLVVGAGGLLGSAWVRWLSAQEETEVVCVGRSAPPGRIERNTTVRSLVSAEEMASWKPYAILHVAGPSHFATVAENPDTARDEAVSLARLLVATARESRAKLVFLSCDRVFDAGEGPFEETAVPQPATPLGLALHAVEKVVEEGLDDRLIIRTSALYGWAPHRTEARLTRWLKRWQAQQTIAASGESLASPTWIDEVPRVVHTLLRRDGLFHVAGPQRMSLHDLARLAARAWEVSPDLVRASDETADGTPFRGGLVAERYVQFASALHVPEACLPDVHRQSV